VRRLRLILLNTATIVSLLLCVATVALWVRSRWLVDYVTVLDLQTFEGMFCSHHDGLKLMPKHRHSLVGEPYPSTYGWVVMSVPVPNADPVIRPEYGRYAYGFGWERRTLRIQWGGGSYTDELYGLLLPHWAAVVVTAALPLSVTAARRRARRRTQLGLCPACGYDLRATPDRCPECGAVPVHRPI
jgi:hypothetical protein